MFKVAEHLEFLELSVKYHEVLIYVISSHKLGTFLLADNEYMYTI